MLGAGRSFVGCSGYDYADWRGDVYPADLPKRAWLPCYAETFDTVELNSTFYRLPTAAAVEGWGGAVPDDFVFAVKMGAFGSHRKKLLDAGTWLPNHVDRFTGLGAALGPTLVQLPPRWRRNVQRLDEFFACAPPSMRWALELREPSWVDESVFDVLRRYGVALCIHDLLADHPRVLTTDWTYLRFHGPDALRHRYYGAYGHDRLAPWADWINEQLEAGADVHAYFNNDYHGHAFRDAQLLRELLVA